MSNRGTALIDGRYAEFQTAVLQQLPREIPAETLKHWIDDRESLARVLQSALVPIGINNTETLPDIDWRRVYQELGMSEDLLKLFPDNSKLEGQNGLWAIPVLPGVTPNKIVATFRRLGVDVYTYIDDLDNSVSNDRNPFETGGYIVRSKRTVEADPENANQSANDRKKKKATDITLTERLLLELGYFLATGEHLDVENVTLCTGSRHSDGGVPSVGWGADRRELYVDWCSPDDRDDYLRARAAV